MRNRTPFNMSGGEKQFVAFGIVLVHSPKLILLDEPFAGIDQEKINVQLEWISNLNNENATFIIVEHELVSIIKNEFRIIKLNLGRIE